MKTFSDIPIIKEVINDIKVAEFLGEQIVYMRKTLEERPTTDHIPILLIKSIKRGTMDVQTDVVGIADMDEDRYKTFYKLGQHFGANSIPLVVVFFSEGWMTTVDQDSKEPFVPPSQSPKRKEVLMFTAMTIEMKTIGSIYETLRDDNDNMKIGPLMHAGSNTSMESNLLRQFMAGAVSMLKPK